MYNYFVYCAWIEQALDFMIVWIWCTRACSWSTRYPGRSSMCAVHELYKPWIPWLCEYVHVILADLPCVPYMSCTSPGFLDCVNMYTWQVTDIPPSLDILYIHYMLIGNSEQTHKHYIETEIINVNIDIFTLTYLFLVFYVEVYLDLMLEHLCKKYWI